MGDREERQANQPDDEVVGALYFNEGEDLNPNMDPCVGGGTDRGTWWMGRPNLTAECLIWSKSAHARRPTNFRSTAMIEEACKKG